MLNFVDCIQKINKKANLTILISNTEKKDVDEKQFEKNFEYKYILFGVHFRKNIIAYKKTLKDYYGRVAVERKLKYKLYDKLMDSLDKLLKEKITFDVDIFDDNDKKFYEEKKLIKEAEIADKHPYFKMYEDVALEKIVIFEKYLFENPKLLKRYMDSAKYAHIHMTDMNMWLRQNKKELCEPILNNIGKFLCKNIDNIDIRRFIFNSILFQSIAVEYAYSIGQNDLAEKIIYLGYDRYFEIETFYFLKKHNEKLFYEEINKVKKICFKRILDRIQQYTYMDIYEKEFIIEIYQLAKQKIKEIKNAPDDDPRKNDEHIIPDWAK